MANLAKYLGVSKPTISQYIQLGMPCGRVGNRLHFQTDNVDRWLMRITNKRYAGKVDPQSQYKHQGEIARYTRSEAA